MKKKKEKYQLAIYANEMKKGNVDCQYILNEMKKEM